MIQITDSYTGKKASALALSETKCHSERHRRRNLCSRNTIKTIIPQETIMQRFFVEIEFLLRMTDNKF